MRASQEAAEIAILGPYHPYCPKDHGSRKRVAIVAMSRVIVTVSSERA